MNLYYFEYIKHVFRSKARGSLGYLVDLRYKLKTPLVCLFKENTTAARTAALGLG